MMSTVRWKRSAKSRPAWMERLAPSEQRRTDRLAGLVGPSLGGAVYRVVGDDDLSKPLRH
ncbi:hypothetical protein [Kitasatospora azatica]|uniref:hypothetical protein n=1 Tax=Kitasatospora azatica TaxID=58347 RepID=UPI0012F90DFC|nr:hypothetical protein [Kitasatospora azatica]